MLPCLAESLSIDKISQQLYLYGGKMRGSGDGRPKSLVAATFYSFNPDMVGAASQPDLKRRGWWTH